MNSTHHTVEPVSNKIFVEQIRILYRSIYSVVASNILVSLALVIGLWNILPNYLLVGWFALMIILVAGRYAIFNSYKKHFTEENAKKYASYFTLLAAANGFIWGICGLISFTDENFNYQILVLLALVGWGAGSVTTQHSNLPTFYTYFTLLLTPITLKFFTSGVSFQISIGIMLVAYMMALTYYAININKSLIETLKLRFENMELLAQLRIQKEEAERANLAKSKFLAAASHDLRQPLYALTLFTSALDGVTESPKSKIIINQINTSVSALQKLFDALLDISRLDAGTMKVDKIHFSLQPVFEKLANEYNSLARSKGLNINWHACDQAVFSDVNLLEQILRNIISNSIRYTHTGQIDISCKPVQDKLWISVKDTGIGIPRDKHKLIFEEYSQLNNPERDRSKGLGLGLAIVRRTAALLGHEIELQSEPEKGSTFIIKTDIGNFDKITSLIDFENELLLGESPSKITVLVIDDELDIRTGIHDLLQQWGYNVITAADQDEALNQLSQLGKAPDAIISDYRLREKRTGIEAIQAIHDKFQIKIPALIVTGDIEADRLREVSNSGYPVFHKPVIPGKLRLFLRNIHPVVTE